MINKSSGYGYKIYHLAARMAAEDVIYTPIAKAQVCSMFTEYVPKEYYILHEVNPSAVWLLWVQLVFNRTQMHVIAH